MNRIHKAERDFVRGVAISQNSFPAAFGPPVERHVREQADAYNVGKSVGGI